VSLADAYSATPGQPCPEKTGVRHDAHRSSQWTATRPDWYEPSDILIGHPQTLIHNAYVGAARLFSMRQKRPCVSPSRTGPQSYCRRSPYMYATVTLPRSETSSTSRTLWKIQIRPLSSGAPPGIYDPRVVTVPGQEHTHAHMLLYQRQSRR
jgi:hypothetical protein